MQFPELSVAENILVGRQPRNRLGLVDRRRMNTVAEELLSRLGHELDVRRPVRELSVADRQMVEVAKALVGETRLLILDEPTAVISGHEVELLFERMRRLKAEGVSIVYISHRLEEIFEIADRVTVLKDGRVAGAGAVAEMTREGLISMMVGRELTDIYPPRKPVPDDAPEVLSIEDLAVGGRVRGVGFSVRSGEILGLAGLIGAGRADVAHAIFGSASVVRGRITIDGRLRERTSPRQSIDDGIGFLTEDRKVEGLFLELDLAANVSAPSLSEIAKGWMLDLAVERRICEREIARFAIAARSPADRIVALSGGNQQKALFSRWARRCERLLILDEPTRGVDVGAKVEIYRIIRQLADAGVAILMISSELPEIVGMCDRVVVMREGVKTGELAGDDVTEERIMDLATFSQRVELAGAVAHG